MGAAVLANDVRSPAYELAKKLREKLNMRRVSILATGLDRLRVSKTGKSSTKNFDIVCSGDQYHVKVSQIGKVTTLGMMALSKPIDFDELVNVLQGGAA